MAQKTFRDGLSAVAVRVCVGLVAAGLLGGCGDTSDDAAPTTTQPPVPTAEPIPEPTEEAPEEPVAPLPRNGTPDERDAEAAGEFFMRLYEYTLRTGDTEQWVERSLPGCEFCTNVVEDVETRRADGTAFRGLDIDVQRARFVVFEEALRMFGVEVPYEITDVQVVDSDGELINTYDGGPGFALLELAYAPATGWLLRTGNDRDESVL